MASMYDLQKSSNLLSDIFKGILVAVLISLFLIISFFSTIFLTNTLSNLGNRRNNTLDFPQNLYQSINGNLIQGQSREEDCPNGCTGGADDHYWTGIKCKKCP